MDNEALELLIKQVERLNKILTVTVLAEVIVLVLFI